MLTAGRGRLAAVLLLGLTVSGLAAQEVLEEIVETTYPVEARSKFTLSNQDGSIRIYGADTDQMRLQAIKKAYSKDRLGKIQVDVAVKPGLVTVRTTYPPTPRWGLSDRSGTVDYVIVLPWQCDVEEVRLANGEMLIEGMRGREVHAQLGSGRMFSHNCFTDLDLSLGTGGLDVAYDWWEPQPIRLDSRVKEGNTRVFVPGEAQCRLEAETADGNIISDFTAKEDRKPGGQNRLDCTIGTDPNANITITAVKGSIRIKEANL
jgi:hypothetical protein